MKSNNVEREGYKILNLMKVKYDDMLKVSFKNLSKNVKTDCAFVIGY
jgi:hypothetical protein